jgi:hypothetical protein
MFFQDSNMAEVHSPGARRSDPRLSDRARRYAALGALCFLRCASVVAQSDSLDTTAASTTTYSIEPMTAVNASAGTGYYSDPYPIHLTQPREPSVPQLFSGTTKNILSCSGTPQAECFQETPLTITVGKSLREQAQSQGATVAKPFINNNIYQDHNGQWHMATTLYVGSQTNPDEQHWTVILHAHPTDPDDSPVPTHWVADTLLVGSFAERANANYDAKYYEDSDNLYLIYSKRLAPVTLSDGNVAQHDGIVAQLMDSATVPAGTAPTVLLRPATENGGYNSEYFFVHHQSNFFKLIETGNITKIRGKYVMAYSTGDFEEPDYKTGVAWSDTFLPQPGATYKRVLQRDSAGVWGQPDHMEVRYLLQAEKCAWPNYVASQVLAPGVPSLVKDKEGAWYLYFAGYAPAARLSSAGNFDPSRRRPLFAPLQIDIPSGVTVSATPTTALADWITLATQH